MVFARNKDDEARKSKENSSAREVFELKGQKCQKLVIIRKITHQLMQLQRKRREQQRQGISLMPSLTRLNFALIDE